MIELGGVTAMAVELALDAAVVRHYVISNNLANAQTPGFAPVRLAFEEQLRSAQGLLDAGDDEALRARITELQEQLTSPGVLRRRGGDDPVEVDTEMVKLADNTIRYRALVEAYSRRAAILRAAIQEGRP